MGWFVAFVVIAAIVASLVGGSVLHPVLYGLLIADIIIVPLGIFTSIGNGIIDAIFGRRK